MLPTGTTSSAGHWASEDTCSPRSCCSAWIRWCNWTGPDIDTRAWASGSPGYRMVTYACVAGPGLRMTWACTGVRGLSDIASSAPAMRLAYACSSWELEARSASIGDTRWLVSPAHTWSRCCKRPSLYARRMASGSHCASPASCCTRCIIWELIQRDWMGDASCPTRDRDNRYCWFQFSPGDNPHSSAHSEGCRCRYHAWSCSTPGGLQLLHGNKTV